MSNAFGEEVGERDGAFAGEIEDDERVFGGLVGNGYLHDGLLDSFSRSFCFYTPAFHLSLNVSL